ncbi:MAG: hypothetical protein HKO89_01995, partial [Saprospiraceae bacterium]|nr:hypothetical protein [Saprospiraceae bacterium]
IAMLFITIGILNIFLVHPLAGIFYILLSIIYLPPIHRSLQSKFGFSINNVLKFVLAILILWGTLAVGDLMELFETWMLGS